MSLPILQAAEALDNNKCRLYISAYGFEERSLGWTNHQLSNLKDRICLDAFIICYVNSKGINKIKELRENLTNLGVVNITEFKYDVFSQQDIEVIVEEKLRIIISNYEEIVLDITSLTKFLILIFLSKLESFKGNLRIVYSEAENYSPNKTEFEKWKDSMKSIAKFPSKGFRTILRAKCLSSIRMQGQPITLIAFTSFNEQLLRYLLGSLSPYRLLFINGKPPRKELCWREHATQYIHRRLISEYQEENEIDEEGNLLRSSSTLNYMETTNILINIYLKYGNYERLIVAVTGSKMQTLGVYFMKKIYSDIHIEYPTPDSYYIKGFSVGIKNVYEVKIDDFSFFIDHLSNSYFHK